MKIALFLGAGASVPYDMPTTGKIKLDLTKIYRNRQAAEGLGSSSGLLYSALMTQGFQDIEDVYQALSEWTAFGANYRYAKKHLQDSPFTIRLVLEGRETNFTMHDLLLRAEQAKHNLEDEVFDAYRWKHEQDEKLSGIYSRIFDFILEYSNEVHVFTTNYDRAIETFCVRNKTRLQYIDGFMYDPEIGFSIWGNGDYAGISAKSISNKVKVFLYKIHGSLDWKRHKIHGVVRTGVESREGDPNFEQNIVIYPSISPKQDAEEKPYSDVLKNMSQFAKTADCFVVIGYSFRDHNINDIFSEFTSRGKTLISISPTTIREYREHILKERPSEQEIQAWRGHTSHDIRKTSPDGPEDRDIHLVQKELRIDNISELVQGLHSVIGRIGPPLSKKSNI